MVVMWDCNPLVESSKEMNNFELPLDLGTWFLLAHIEHSDDDLGDIVNLLSRLYDFPEHSTHPRSKIVLSYLLHYCEIVWPII